MITNELPKREIKFRAWDKKNKVMIINSTRRISFRGTIEGTNSQILMQYTGLKDKNGVEIYEGDIVQYEYADYGCQRGYFTFCEGSYYLYGTGKWRPLNCTVIGNIFENPELLETN